MRPIALSIFFVLNVFISSAQEPELPPSTTEQQLENITENNEDQETEDDSFLQEMMQYQRNPLNLNEADETTLKEFRMLTPIQIQNLISYRAVLGNFLHIYELQAIPGWDLMTIRKLRPFITVSNRVTIANDFSARLREGEHTLMFRVSQVIEKSKGFLLDSSQASSYYLGDPQRYMFRYKYTFKNLLQYGVTGEKDAGEQFFKGAQKSGFDFYSAHFFARNIGVIKSLALGDFTVNLGQGLTQWQSMAFKKGPDVVGTKRQAAVLRPYSSAGEIFYHRGAGITLGKPINNGLGSIEATVFGSYKNLDANFVSDTAVFQEDIITSFQVSGYHRTPSEVADRGVQRQLAFGGNASYRYKRLHVGINGIGYKFKYPLQKDDQIQNKYAFAGSSFGNYSVDYSYTLRNLHFFGEAARSTTDGLAFVNGLLISTSSNIDMSFFYRNIEPQYQSMYTNAFTESTAPTNEKGFFAGISIKPVSGFQIDAYADVYRFPAPRFRVNSPSNGSDFFIQAQYRPNRQLDMYTRYKRESKGINFNPEELALHPVIMQPRQNWRTQFSYKINPSVTLRSRTELVWFDRRGAAAEEGFLIYGDVLFKPMLKRFSGNMRLLYFETDGYNSRLYTYENDVLYSFSIPVFSGKGYRYYMNLNYDITRKLTGWLKVSRTTYSDRKTVGSGLDEIEGKHRTDVKIQLMYRF